MGKWLLNGLKKMKYNLLKSLMVTLLLNFCFYRSIWGLLPTGILGILFYREEKKEFLRREDEALRQQFKDLLYLVCAGLKAGYSIENAFIQSYGDLSDLYGEDSRICKLIKKLKAGLENHIPLSELWKRAAGESKIVEIGEFAVILEIAVNSGGNITAIMENTAKVISNKTETKKEIHTLLSAKKLEQKIMNAMPVLLLLYVELTSPGYFDAMYGSLPGILLMSLVLIIYASAYFWGKRISSFLL